MRELTAKLIPICGAVLLLASCAEGPQEKLGRGIVNSMEIFRMGEMRRAITDTGVLDSPNLEFTTGVIRGANRTMLRTAYGFYEVFTFPWPNHKPKDYGPIFFYGNPALKNSSPVYPDAYKPQILADETDFARHFARLQRRGHFAFYHRLPVPRL